MKRDAGILLASASEWRLAGLLFECPGEAWRRQVEALSRDVADDELRIAATTALADATESLYHSTFGPGGPAGAREVSHRESLISGQLLHELNAYYGAFGYQPATSEPPDHIAVEAGFVAYLKLKGAYALERGDAEQAGVTSAAESQFITDHVASIVRPLGRTLSLSGIAYLDLACKVLLRYVDRQSPPKAADPCEESQNAGTPR